MREVETVNFWRRGDIATSRRNCRFVAWSGQAFVLHSVYHSSSPHRYTPHHTPIHSACSHRTRLHLDYTTTKRGACVFAIFKGTLYNCHRTVGTGYKE
ncbi:hypothetical protein ACLKA6_015444 [Drosophila palustris]